MVEGNIRTAEDITNDLNSLTHWYKLSKQINVPMTTEKVFECIEKILTKQPELR